MKKAVIFIAILMAATFAANAESYANNQIEVVELENGWHQLDFASGARLVLMLGKVESGVLFLFGGTEGNLWVAILNKNGAIVTHNDAVYHANNVEALIHILEN